MLHVPAFGGGVVLEGSADLQRIDELEECDSYDIGPRGQLIAASDLTDYVDLKDLQGVPASWDRIDNLFAWDDLGVTRILLIGAGDDATPDRRFLRAFTTPSVSEGLVATDVAAIGIPADDPGTVQLLSGAYVTFVQFPYVDANGVQLNPTLIAIGARERAGPKSYPQLQVLYRDGAGVYQCVGINQFDALGTGPLGEFTGGTAGQSLNPVFITAYNGHVFLAGYDHSNTATGFGRGPNRLMFSNAGKPLKYGDDNIALAGANRGFSDTDAYLIGESGDVLRAGLPWAEVLALGTKRGLFFLHGYGRDSFVVHSAKQGRRNVNVLGPYAMIEGPDGALYGVGAENGLWHYDGGVPDDVGAKLRNFRGKSHHWWDLIWTDPTRADAYLDPGPTNQDMVWMAKRGRQVWIGIPWCNATAGHGYGTDTVVIKYHVDTGGFTRQVFAGRILRNAAQVTLGHTSDASFLVLQQTASFHVKRYAKKALATSSPIMPATLPVATWGEYAPFGPNGVGMLRRLPLTISWEEAASLPLAFTATLFVDQQELATHTLSIRSTAPGAPADGDLWLDTSGTDAVIGVANSSPLHAAAQDSVLKQWDTARASWRHIAGGGGKGTRATVPLTFKGTRGTRVKLRLVCTVGTGRYQLEGLGQKPTALKESV